MEVKLNFGIKFIRFPIHGKNKKQPSPSKTQKNALKPKSLKEEKNPK